MQNIKKRNNWLPELLSQSVLLDHFPCQLPSLNSKCHRERVARGGRGTAIVVTEWQHMLNEGLVKNRAELARRAGVSRARVTQALLATPLEYSSLLIKRSGLNI